MPVHIGEFEVSSPVPAPAPVAPAGIGGNEQPTVITAPAQAQRTELERRERALRVFAH